MRPWPGDREKQTNIDKMVPELEFMVLVGGLSVGQVAKGVKLRPRFPAQVTDWGQGTIEKSGWPC